MTVNLIVRPCDSHASSIVRPSDCQFSTDDRQESSSSSIFTIIDRQEDNNLDNLIDGESQVIATEC